MLYNKFFSYITIPVSPQHNIVIYQYETCPLSKVIIKMFRVIDDATYSNNPGKHLPRSGIQPGILDLHSNALSTELSRHVVPTYISLYDSGVINMIFWIILWITLIILNMDQGKCSDMLKVSKQAFPSFKGKTSLKIKFCRRDCTIFLSLGKYLMLNTLLPASIVCRRTKNANLAHIH